jgi:hypothetical protein
VPRSSARQRRRRPKGPHAEGDLDARMDDPGLLR